MTKHGGTIASQESEPMTETPQETKSKRVFLLMPPTLVRDIKILSGLQGRSFNSLINEVMEKYRDANQAALKAVSKIKTESPPPDFFRDKTL